MVPSSRKRVTRQLYSHPPSVMSDKAASTSGSGIPVANEISVSSCCPCCSRCCRISVACMSLTLVTMDAHHGTESPSSKIYPRGSMVSTGNPVFARATRIAPKEFANPTPAQPRDTRRASTCFLEQHRLVGGDIRRSHREFLSDRHQVRQLGLAAVGQGGEAGFVRPRT
jgi:hypothetical protein